jgi:hypothetical protein
MSHETQLCLYGRLRGYLGNVVTRGECLGFVNIYLCVLSWWISEDWLCHEEQIQ